MNSKKGSFLGKSIGMIIFVAFLVIAVFVIKNMVYDPMIDDAADSVMRSAVSSKLSNEDAVKLDDALSKMSDEDKEEVKDIILSNVDPTDVPELISDYKDGNIAAIMEYANDNLDDEDKNRLTEIIQKYR